MTQATNNVTDTTNTGALTQANAGNVLSGNILAGASWNSTNNTLADQLTASTGLQTINTAVGGATTADTLNQLNTFIDTGGSFAPGSTVFLQTGGVDMLYGVDDATITNNINQIVSTLGAQGVNVVLTTSPRAGSLNDVVNNNFETGPASFYSDIAANNSNVVTVDTMGQILQDKSLLRDALHTNAAGEQIYNASVMAAYERLNPSQKIEVANKVAATGGASAPEELAQAIDEVAGTNVAATAAQATTPSNTVAVQLQGQTYNVSAADVNKVKDQILAQGTTSKWTGQGFGSAEANAEAMAKNLVASGVTDINQVAMIDKKVDAQVTSDGQGGFVDALGRAVDASLVKADTVYSGGDAGTAETVYTAPVGTEKVLGNKVTGQALISDYDRSGGNTWSGTFTGEGNTAFRTSFDASGKPIFYTTGASSNDIVTMIGDDPILGKIATVAAGYFGGPAGVAALQAAMGKSVEDIAKGALLTYVGGQVAGNIAGSTDLVSSIGADATNVLAKGAGQFVSSGGKADIVQSLVGGAVDVGVNQITSLIPDFSSLPQGAQDFTKTVVATTIKNGGDLSVGNLVDAALTAGTAAVKASTTGTIATAIQADKTINDAVTAELDKQLTIDASGARDVNAAAEFADAQGYTKFTFDGKTYTLGNNNAENTVKQLEADALATNTAATTAANLKGGEFEGVDAAVAANAAKNNTVIGNTEADTVEEAAALAKTRNPTGTTFTFGGQTYTIGTSNAQVQAALNETKLAETQSKIEGAKTFNEAYDAARTGLGAGKVFTWNGKQYTTDTREENPALAAASDVARLNNIAASTEAGGGRGSATSYANYDATAAANALDKTKVIPDYTAGDAYGFNDTVYDSSTGVALLNSKATADPNTALGKAVIAANNALGSVVQTGMSNLAQAGGEQLAAFGGALATIGVTDANNMLVKAGQAAQQVGSAIETAESKQGTQNIVNAVSKAEGMGGKLIAGLKAGWENPVAALNMITREGFQEILPAGVALKASKIMSLAAAAGIDTALNAGESMGQAYNDAYSAAIAKGMTKEAADALATKVGLSAGAITLVTSGVMDAALIKTVFREGSGTVSSQLVKGSTKEGISENIEETATALATQYLTTGKIDLGDAMTQGALGHLIGKTTAGSVGAVDVAAQTETINNNITAAVTSGDAASLNTAITNSVQSSLTSGASVEVAVGASVTSAITNGADTSASITTAVTSAIDSGADVTQTVTASIDSAINAGADSTVAIDSTVTSAITSGADTSQVVDSAVTSAVTAGADMTTSITTAVKAAVDNGADVMVAANAATTAAVTASVNSGADVSTAITTAVDAAVSAGADVTTATTTATSAAVTASITAGTDTTTAIKTAVEAAVTAGANVQTATNTATSAAVTASVSSGTDVATSISTAVEAAVTAGADANVAATAATTAAVTADITSGTDTSTAITKAVEAAVDAGASVTSATDAAVTAAVSTAVAQGTETSVAIDTSVTAAVSAGADVSTAVDTAITAAVDSSVTTAVNSGTDVSTAITESVTSSITSAVTNDTSVTTAVETAVTAAVTSAITNDADVSTAVSSAVDSAITAAVTNDTSISTAVDSAVTSAVTAAITNNADTSTAISSAVDSAITSAVTNNADTTTAITTAVDSAVTAAITNDATVETAVSSAVESAVSSAITNNVDATTAVSTAIDSAITAAVTSDADVSTAVDSAVSSAITSAVDSNVDVTTAIDSAVSTAVTSAINSNTNANTAIDTAVNSAVTTAIDANTNVSVDTNINTAINAAVNAAVDANVNINTATDTAVTAAVNAAVTSNVDVNTAIDAAVNAAVNVNPNIDIPTITKVATDAATEATEKVELINTVNDLISEPTKVTPTVTPPVTPPVTPKPVTPKKTPAGLTAGLMAGAITGAEMARLPPTMLKAYMTNDKFVDPLAKLHALQEDMNTEKMSALPKVNTQESDMPDQGTWRYGNAPDDLDTLFGTQAEEETAAFKAGGYVAPLQMASGGMPLPLLVKSGGALGALPRNDGRLDFRHGAHVAGDGDGQSDDIKAMLADGEFVFPADVVSALGNGSTKAGSDKLYEMMHSIRERARSKKPKDLPPPALKSPLDYLKKVRST